MSTKTSSSAIQDWTDDWGNATADSLPHSGQQVQDFLKEQINKDVNADNVSYTEGSTTTAGGTVADKITNLAQKIEGKNNSVNTVIPIVAGQTNDNKNGALSNVSIKAGTYKLTYDATYLNGATYLYVIYDGSSSGTYLGALDNLSSVTLANDVVQIYVYATASQSLTTGDCLFNFEDTNKGQSLEERLTSTIEEKVASKAEKTDVDDLSTSVNGSDNSVSTVITIPSSSVGVGGNIEQDVAIKAGTYKLSYDNTYIGSAGYLYVKYSGTDKFVTASPNYVLGQIDNVVFASDIIAIRIYEASSGCLKAGDCSIVFTDVNKVVGLTDRTIQTIEQDLTDNDKYTARNNLDVASKYGDNSTASIDIEVTSSMLSSGGTYNYDLEIKKGSYDVLFDESIISGSVYLYVKYEGDTNYSALGTNTAIGQVAKQTLELAKNVTAIRLYGSAALWLKEGTLHIEFNDANKSYGEFPFYGETWAALGDSGVAATYFENYVKRAMRLSEFASCGVNGAPMSGDESGTGDEGTACWYTSRIEELPVNADQIVIFAGTNDMYQAWIAEGKGTMDNFTGIGELSKDNYDVKTFVGAYNVCLSKLYYKYCKLDSGYYSEIDYSGITQASEQKDIRIIMMTPFPFYSTTQTLGKDAPRYSSIMSEWVKKIAAMWSIPCIDLQSCSNLTSFNMSFTIQSDNIHPTKQGHKHIANLIIAKSKECFLIR